MARLTPDELTRFHDGELSAAERGRLEEALAAGAAEDRDSLRRLDRIGDLVRLMNEEELSQVSFDGFAERVAEGIRASAKPPLAERARVWASEFFEHRRIVWIPAASLVAAAAAILIALPVLRAPGGGAAPSGAAAQGIWTAAAGASAEVPRGSEAILANRDKVSGTEYTLSNDRGEKLGVVWVND
jgi:hypothetical protein